MCGNNFGQGHGMGFISVHKAYFTPFAHILSKMFILVRQVHLALYGLFWSFRLILVPEAHFGSKVPFCCVNL